MLSRNGNSKRRLTSRRDWSTSGADIARALVTLVCLCTCGCQCQLIGSAGINANVDRCQLGAAAAAGGSLTSVGSDVHLGPLLSSAGCLPIVGSSFGGGASIADKGANTATTDGVFWSDAVERLLPPTERSHRQRHWRHHARNQAVSSVQPHCGRLRGAYTVTFEDGRTRACARPQYDADQLLGTVYARALADLLGLGGHVPTTVLVLPPELEPDRWSAVAGDIRSWRQGRPVAYVDLAEGSRLDDAILPQFLADVIWSSGLTTVQQGRPLLLTPKTVARLSLSEAAVLAQWSDLVLFDYVTAHSDRIINGIVNSQWTGGGGAQVRRWSIHKMATDVVDGLLMYTDNEDAIFQGYSLLNAVAEDGQQYASHHEAILSRLCVFRASTVDAIEKYHRSGDLANELVKAVEQHDAGIAERFLPYVGPSMGLVLQQRLAQVAGWVRNCSLTYGGRGAREPHDGWHR